MQLQASLIGKISLIASLLAQLEQLRHSLPGLESRIRLTARLEQMEQQQRALRLQLTELRAAAASAPRAAPESVPKSVPKSVPESAPTAEPTPAQQLRTSAASNNSLCLQQRAVLCVGRRSGNVAN